MGSSKEGIGRKRYREEAAKLVGIKQTGRDKKWYRKQDSKNLHVQPMN